MTRQRYISEEFASYLMTGRPVLAHRELANALSSILRPRGMDWFQPRTAIDAINNDRGSKEWLPPARPALLYRTWHLRDCVWAENADLAIDQFHRKWKLDARALCRLYPDTVSPEVKTRAEKDPFAEVNCRVIVLPADEYDGYGADEDGQPQQRSGAYPF